MSQSGRRLPVGKDSVRPNAKHTSPAYFLLLASFVLMARLVLRAPHFGTHQWADLAFGTRLTLASLAAKSINCSQSQQPRRRRSPHPLHHLVRIPRPLPLPLHDPFLRTCTPDLYPDFWLHARVRAYGEWGREVETLAKDEKLRGEERCLTES